MWSSTVSYGAADIYKSQLHTLMSKHNLDTINHKHVVRPMDNTYTCTKVRFKNLQELAKFH